MKSPYPALIKVRKLYHPQDKFFLDKIWEYNIDEKHFKAFKKVYPQHAEWLKKAKADVEKGERIIFGAFVLNLNSDTRDFCGSVIISRNFFSPYLEIKNLVAFEDVLEKINDENSEIFVSKKDVFEQIIKYIIGFASQRGFPRLTTELIYSTNKDLVKLFIDKDFFVTGRQAPKYNQADEIIFLTKEVNQVYAFDPFDNYRATEWILNKFLNAQNIEESDVKLFYSNKNFVNGKSFIFYNGNKYENEIKERFNTLSQVLIIQEYFKELNRITKIENVEFSNSNISRYFIFDYSTHSGIPNSDQNVFSEHIINDKKNSYFKREDLDFLLGGGEEIEEGKKVIGIMRRCNYEDLGGLLVISNPTKFPAENDFLLIQQRGKIGLYIKLGNYGQYLESDMPVIFAYYANDTKNTLKIWGISYITQPTESINIEEYRKSFAADFPVLNNSEGEALLSDIDFFWTTYFKTRSDYEPLWKQEEFTTHNLFNASKNIVCIPIENFIDLRSQHKSIAVEDFIDRNKNRNEKQYIFDFYVTKTEVERLRSLIQSNVKISVPPDPIIKAPKKIFLSYARADIELKKEFDNHLSALKRSKKIETWSDQEILPGQDWDVEIKKALYDADLALLLISPDFMGSEYIWHREIPIAIEKGVIIIPIFLIPVDFKETVFEIYKNQGLPSGGWIVTNTKIHRDEGYLEVVKGLHKLL